MEVMQIFNWGQFDSIARNLDGWAFRGQRDANWPLYSSLSRYLKVFAPDPNFWQEREQRAIRIFRRKAHNYISDLRILEDDLRCLALMQHHGAPTRLIDFTKSPYVAAFFALEQATGEAAVFALNTPVLWNATWNVPSVSLPGLTHSKIDPRVRDNFQKYFAANKYELVWTGEPSEMDRRLLAQSGTFVVPGVLDKPVEDILEQYPSTELLKKLVFSGLELREECMRSLYRMNITNATLFPDLDGLAKSIGFELETFWRGLGTVSHPAELGGHGSPTN